MANKFSGSSIHSNLTRGDAVFFDGWLLINQAETGADTRECTRLERVRGDARDGLFVGSSCRYFRQLFNLRAFRAGSSRTNDFTLGLLSPFSLSLSLSHTLFLSLGS